MATGIDATTPQLKAVKNLLDAYLTLDVKNVEPFISKNFTFQTFPKIADHPEEAKGAHFERYGTLLNLLKKGEIHCHEVIEAPGKVVLHVSPIMWTTDDTRLDYESLIIFTLVEEDGELKIDNFKDFSDPEKRSNVHGWIAKTLDKRAT